MTRAPKGLTCEGAKLIKYPGNNNCAYCRERYSNCTHILILDVSPQSDLTPTSACCCSLATWKAQWLCVKCDFTSNFCQELHQGSKSNKRLLYTQVTPSRKPSRNIKQLPHGWLSSSWPNLIGTWHTQAQLHSEVKLFICYLLGFECAMFCTLSWVAAESFRGGA